MSDKEWFAGAGAASLEIVSLRDPSVGDSTAAYVEVDGKFFCHSIEDVIREPREGRPIGDWAALERWVLSWKVPGKTATPAGRYPVIIDISARFKKPMIHIQRVPGFTGIRAHGGLNPQQTEGCTILGDEIHQTAAGWRVSDGKSKPAVDRIFAVIEDALARDVEVWWTFKLNPNAMKAAA